MAGKTPLLCRKALKKTTFVRQTNVVFFVEQVMGIEPTYSAWEADVLPMNYTCDCGIQYSIPPGKKSRGGAQILFRRRKNQEQWVKMVWGVRAPLE